MLCYYNLGETKSTDLVSGFIEKKSSQWCLLCVWLYFPFMFGILNSSYFSRKYLYLFTAQNNFTIGFYALFCFYFQFVKFEKKTKHEHCNFKPITCSTIKSLLCHLLHQKPNICKRKPKRCVSFSFFSLVS